MKRRFILLIIISFTSIITSQAQLSHQDSVRLKEILESPEEIKLNQEAIKSIDFNFSRLPKEIKLQPQMNDEKPWLEFTTDLPEEFIRNERPEMKMNINFDLSLPSQTSQAAIGFDADKILFETFTKRGRAIKRNRKHANAWKTYLDTPTTKDSLALQTPNSTSDEY